jgi:hypothetical protein
MVRRSYLAIVVQSHCFEGKPFVVRCKVEGKKKVMKKQRRSKQKVLREKLSFVARIGV